MPQMPKVAELRAMLHDLPIEDQLATLLLAILDDNNDALSVSLRLTYAIRRLSAEQSGINRFRISEELRNLADALERPLVVTEV
jgi:hypothetical protein